MTHVLTLFMELPDKQWMALKEYVEDSEQEIMDLMSSAEFVESSEKLGATHWERTLVAGKAADYKSTIGNQ